MIKIGFNKACGRCIQSEPLTSGMVGQTIQFDYSADFDGLTITAVFTNGKTTVDVLNPGVECVIPHEVLTTVGTAVSVGLYAVKGSTLVIPTVYAPIGVVLRGADPSGDTSADPTPGVYNQIMERLNNLEGVNPATAGKLGVVKIGENLKITNDGVLSVDTADAVEQDNTRPVTSAAVHTEIGNIEVLLAAL